MVADHELNEKFYNFFFLSKQYSFCPTLFVLFEKWKVKFFKGTSFIILFTF